MQLLWITPKNWLSYLVGKLANIPLPNYLNQILINWYCKKYGVNLDEIEFPPQKYESLSLFFVRNLKAGIRPIGTEPVAPADSYLRSFEEINSDKLVVQAKDKKYLLTDFLGSSTDANRYLKGHIANFYLSPKDYHHVHSPVSGQILKITYIPGALWPVNDWSLHTIKNLFCINERVIIYIQTDNSVIAVVMIGATNVGKITLTFDSLTTNSRPWLKKEIIHKDMTEKNLIISAGDKLGTFHLGSTVILLFEPVTKGFNLLPRSIKYGQSLLME